MDHEGPWLELRHLGTGARTRTRRDREPDDEPVVDKPRLDPGKRRRDEGPIDRYAEAGAGEVAPAALAQVGSLLTPGGGAPLPAELAARLGAALGVDLAGVRVHTDAAAARAASLLSARAFTIGQDVYFAAGTYAPDDDTGSELLCHELAHVAQNLRGEHRDRRRVSSPDQAHEREADAIARQLRSYRAAPSSPAAVATALARHGLRVEDAELAHLATSYGDGLDLAQRRLGSADGADHLAQLIAHARGHACDRGCAVDDAAPRIERLDDGTRATVERATGLRLPEIQVELDATMSAAGRLAEAVGPIIRMAPGAPRPDEPDGRRILLHEAMHVAQQQVGDAAPPRDRTASVEAEAHAAVDAAERGDPARLHTRAEPDTAYGFGVGDVVSAVGNAVGVDPIQWLLDHVPAIGQLRSGGLQPFLSSIGQAAGAALGPIFDGLDPGRLASTVTDLFSAFSGGKLAFGVLTGCCECFGEALQKMVTGFQGFLAGDRAQAMRSWFDGLQQGVIDSLLDNLTDMFAALRRWGAPLVALIDAVSAGIDFARSVIGDLADQAWREVICPPLGLDPSLPPRQAIEKRLGELWAPIQAVIDQVRRGIDALWQKLKQNPVIAKVLKLVDDCRRLAHAIELCRAAQTRDPQKWLTILAAETRGTIFEGLIEKLQAGHDLAIETRDAAVNWVLGILDDLGILSAWNSSVPMLQQIGQAILAFVGTIRGAILTVRTAIQTALTELAGAATRLWDGVRPLLNFAIGFALAASALATGNPLPMITFLASQAFLALPDCHKEQIANAVLDLFIAFVEFVPARLPPIVIIKGAALGFLRTLRGAPTAQKIAAMDNIARMISFDVEMMAGFVVGVVEGLWASALGLIVRIAIWPMRQILDGLLGLAQQAAELAGRTFAGTLDALDWLGEALSGATPLPAPGSYEGGPLGGGDPATGGGGTRTDVNVIGRGETPPVTPAAGGGGGDDGTGFDAAPAFPELADPVDLFNHIFRRGVTREELESLLTRFNAGLDAVAGRAGEQAATRLIEFFANRSTPYRVGEVLGEVVGWIAGELIVIIATIGIGAAVLEGARGVALLAEIGMNFPRLLQALNSLRGALQPLIRVVAQWGDDFVRVFRSVMTWLDDMAIWAERQFVRLLNWIAQNPRAAWRWYRRLRRLWGAVTDDDDEALEGLAREAADEAWDYLLGNMRAEVRDEAGVRALLTAVNVTRRRSVDIHLQIHHTDGDGWAVRATASSDGESVSADVGAGWITLVDPSESRSGDPFYATANHSAEHVSFVEEVIERLRRSAADDRGGGGLEGAYARMVETMRREEAEGRSRLPLAGVTFRITPEGLSDVVTDRLIHTEFLVTPNAYKYFAEISPGHTAFLGAVAGPPGLFHGRFDPGFVVDDTHWNWDDYPTAAITPHPANAFLRYRTATSLDQLKPPAIAYSFIGGRTTGGPHVEEWRDHLSDEINTETEAILVANPGLARAAAETQANARVLTRYQATYPSVLDMQDLELRGARQWQAHHIHEHSWKGGDARDNFQYLLRTGEHQLLSNWWNDRRAMIAQALAPA